MHSPRNNTIFDPQDLHYMRMRTIFLKKNLDAAAKLENFGTVIP